MTVRPYPFNLIDPLRAAIECVLLDHADQIGGDNADPNLSELAYVYEQQTGWTVPNTEAPRRPAGYVVGLDDGDHLAVGSCGAFSTLDRARDEALRHGPGWAVYAAYPVGGAR